MGGPVLPATGDPRTPPGGGTPLTWGTAGSITVRAALSETSPATPRTGRGIALGLLAGAVGVRDAVVRVLPGRLGMLEAGLERLDQRDVRRPILEEQRVQARIGEVGPAHAVPPQVREQLLRVALPVLVLERDPR